MCAVGVSGDGCVRCRQLTAVNGECKNMVIREFRAQGVEHDVTDGVNRSEW